MRMVEILEESYHAEKRQGKEEMGGKSSKYLHAKAPLEEKKEVAATTKEKKGMRRLTDEEVREHIKKGLCFKCGEKWGVGHKCTTGQVLLIVGTSEEEVAMVEESEDEDASLSFHAMTRSNAPDTFLPLGMDR